MAAETHFVQTGDGPVLSGHGAETLCCACGNLLIHGYDPVRVLAIGIQCGQCGTVTTTPALAEGMLPPRSAMIAPPQATPVAGTLALPADVPMVGQAEMARFQALFQPNEPDYVYHLSPALLDAAQASFERLTGTRLPDPGVQSDDPFAGLRDHALGWAVRHLRTAMQSKSWACMADAPACAATTLVTGFLHFEATWSRHPLLPAMVATAAERGFSMHALAPFATAHCLMMMGNRVRFPEPGPYPGRIDGFELTNDPANPVSVHVVVFDRFEFPFGQPWEPTSLRAAVADVAAAAHGRINLRNPGVLVLSPGSALAGYDEALIAAIRDSVQSLGRKNRGLAAAAAFMLRLQGLPHPHSVRLCYSFFPTPNAQYRGATAIRPAAG
jgi:hypothetical protein